MADDEGQDRRSEDLFEDLDKFFAPIQDVDWPEEGAPPKDAPVPAPPAEAGSADAREAPAVAPGGDAEAPIPREEPPAQAAESTPAPGPSEQPAAEQPAEPDTGGFRRVVEPEPEEPPAAASEPFADPGSGGAAPSGPAEPTGSAAAASSSLAEEMFGAPTGPQPAIREPAESAAAASAGDVFGSGAGGEQADDLLPQGWASGLDEGIDLDLDVPPTGGTDVPVAGRSVGEPTAEMTGEDWAELQAGSHPQGAEAGTTPEEGREPYSYMERFLPDEDASAVPEFGYGPDPGTGAAPSGGTTGIDWDEPAAAATGIEWERRTPGASGVEWDEPAAGTTGIDWDQPAAGAAAAAGAAGPASLEDSGPISIDDLRRAPDEYRELPGPDPDDSDLFGAGAGAAAAGAAAAGAAASTPLAGPDDEPDSPEALEAAAEHFAASIREEESHLGGPAAAGGAGAAAAFGESGHREPYSEHPEPLVFPDEDDEEPDDLLSFGEPEGPRTVKVSAAEGAPSWQEPTSVEVPVEGEHEPPRPSRNLSAAIITGIVLAVVALIALAGGKAFFGVVAAAVILLAQLELYTAIRRRGYQPAVPLGLVVGGLICAGGYLKGEGGILAMMLVGALFTPLWYMATPVKQRKNVVANMGMTYVGILAVPFLGGFAMAIIHEFSRAFTIMVLALAFGFDIVAYAVGTISGRKPLAPTISPNKTREGVYGGFLVLAVLGIAVLGNIDPLTNVWQGLFVGIAAAAAATLGDLAESLAKRDLGVKDMGTIFPGHGGALDRIDSVLFVAPVVYYLVKILLS